ncbi:MAG: amidase family protein [Pseudomonadota bacterium]
MIGHGDTSSDLCLKPAHELAGLVASRQISASELTRAYLERISALDVRLGAYLLVDENGALAQAAAIDQALARGELLGPLAGVPIALKDAIVTRGLATTAGSRALEGWIPPYDATVVARLRRAGAVLLGKLNMDEFAMGSSTENSAFRVCRNPWDTQRVPGGSSGGSAVATAAGLAAATLGSATGGSRRQPAALCGVTGLKPTYGRVSRHGLVAFASSLDQLGPITRCVADAALLLEIIAGHDRLDATSIDAKVPCYRDACRQGVGAVDTVEAVGAGEPGKGRERGEGGKGAKELVVGIPDEYFVAGTDPEVESAVRIALAELESLGVRLERVSLPHTEYAIACYYLVATAEASSNLARYDGIRYGQRVDDDRLSLVEMYRCARGSGFGSEVKRRIMLGTYALRAGYYDAYYRKAQQVRALIRQDFDRAFAKVDAIATPVTPTAAFLLGEKRVDPLEMYLADIFTISCNLAGLPGMSIPCGFTSGGLPIGLQLLGRPLDESSLLRIGSAYQQATDWHTRRCCP